MRVDLCEIGGPKRHGDAVVRQAVGQNTGIGLALWLQQRNRVRALGLQPPLHARVRLGKPAQAFFVGVAQRLQMAQHQGRHVALPVTTSVTNGQFNLRQGLDRIHRANQRAHGQQHCADVRRQHRADLHVSSKMAFALMKADQHFAFFAHIAHRQACPVAVGPSRPFDGAQHIVRAHFADVPELVFQGALLDRHLRRRVQMLHFAAAAGARMQAKMRASRAHALRRFVVNLGQRAFVKTVFNAVDVRAHHLKRQGAVDKHHFAVFAVGHALAFQVQAAHRQAPRGRVGGGGRSGIRHA